MRREDFETLAFSAVGHTDLDDWIDFDPVTGGGQRNGTIVRFRTGTSSMKGWGVHNLLDLCGDVFSWRLEADDEGNLVVIIQTRTDFPDVFDGTPADDEDVPDYEGQMRRRHFEWFKEMGYIDENAEF